MGKHTSEVVIKLTDNVSIPMEGVIASWNRGDLVSKKFIKSLENTGRTLRNAGATMFVPAVAGIASTVKAAATAEKSFSKVYTIMDESELSREEMMEQMRETQIKYGQSIGDVADTFYNVISATVDTANAQKNVDVAMKMATGGFADAQTAVVGLTTALQAYKKQGYDAERLGDILAMTQKYGKTTIDELSGSLGEVVQNAVALNVSFEDLGTSLAVLTSNGANTSAATVYLNNALKSIIQPSVQAKKAFESLGIEYGANALNGGTFEEYLNKIKQATGLSKIANEELSRMLNDSEMTEEEMADYYRSAGVNADLLLTMFKNIRGATAMLSMTNNLDKFKEFREGMNVENSEGELDRITNIMLGTTDTQLKILNEKIEVLKSKLGDSLIPKLMPWLEKFEGWVDGLATMSQEQFDSIANTMIEVAKWGAIIMTLGTVAGALANILKVVNLISGAVGAGKVLGAGAKAITDGAGLGGTAKAMGDQIAKNASGAVTTGAAIGLVGMGAMTIEAAHLIGDAVATNIKEGMLISENIENAKLLADEYRAKANEGPMINMGAGPDPRYQIMFNQKADRLEKRYNEGITNNKNISIQSVNVYGAKDIDTITEDIANYLGNAK